MELHRSAETTSGTYLILGPDLQKALPNCRIEWPETGKYYGESAALAISSGSTTDPKPLVAPFDAKQAKAGQAAWAKHLGTTVESKNSVGMTLVLIPPGEFLMGSTQEQMALGVKIAQNAKLKPDRWEWGRIVDEGPQHRSRSQSHFC